MSDIELQPLTNCTPTAQRPTMLQMEYLLGVHQRRLTTLLAVIEQAKEVLDQLSRLGSGSSVGRSEGNRIAYEALLKINESCKS